MEREKIPTTEDAIDAFFEKAHAAMAPATRSADWRYLRSFIAIIALAFAAVFAPVGAAFLFPFEDARLEGKPSDAVETIPGSIKENSLKGLVSLCSKPPNCGPEALEKATAAEAKLVEAAAKKTDRYKKLKAYQKEMPFLLGLAAFLAILCLVLFTQVRVTLRFWRWNVEDMRYHLPRDGLYLPQSQLTLVAYLTGTLLIIAVAAITHAVAAGAGSSPFAVMMWTVVASIAASPAAMALTYVRSEETVRRLVHVTPAIILTICAVAGVEFTLFAMERLPVLANVPEVIKPHWGWLLPLISAVLTMTIGTTALAVQIYSEPYLSPLKAEKLAHRFYALRDLFDEHKRRENKDVGYANAQAMKTGSAKVVTADLPAPTTNSELWLELRKRANTLFKERKMHLRRRDLDHSISPEDLRDAIITLCSAAAAVLVVALIFISIWSHWISGTYGSGDATLSGAREEAFKSYLLCVGLIYSALLACMYGWGQQRLIPYVNAADAAEKAESSSSAASSSTAMPWSVKTVDKDGNLISQTHPLEPGPTQAEAEKAKKKRDKAQKQKRRDRAFRDSDRMLVRHLGFDETKFALIRGGANQGGSFQELMKAEGYKRLLQFLPLIAPTAVTQLLNLLG